MAHASANGEVTTLLTPINLFFVSLLLLTIYMRLRPQKPPARQKAPAPVLFRTFTPPKLAHFNGENNKPIYFAVRGRVFDVTPGRQFYGPGGPYENFAGRDATRGMACQSFDEEMLTKDLHGPLDDLKGLDQEAMANLKNWEETFESKYLTIGRLVPVGHPDADSEEKHNMN